jgi:hypothetical protein
MFGLYIFSLVIGGAFLLLSLFGDAFGTDVDGLDADVDVDLSPDASGLWQVLSLRSVVYALFGFGAVGTMLSLTGMFGTLSTVAYAGTAGVLSGALISWVFGLVHRGDSGQRTNDRSFEGLLGDVTVPFGSDGIGQVAVTLGGRRHVLLARPLRSAAESPEEWKRIVVVELEQGVARVSPAEPDLLKAVED